MHGGKETGAGAATVSPALGAALALGPPCTLMAQLAEQGNTTPQTYARRMLKGLERAAQSHLAAAAAEIPATAASAKAQSDSLTPAAAATSSTVSTASTPSTASTTQPVAGVSAAAPPVVLSSAAWARDPSLLLELEGAARTAVERALQGVPLALVAEDAEACHDYDLELGRFSERIKKVMGDEHEHLLEELLHGAGVVGFLSEGGQRASADGRTPDVLLSGCPVSVLGLRIHWIDSKASFADTDELYEHWSAQFRHYHASFGLGMVLYWFGYSACAPDNKPPFDLHEAQLLPCGPHHVLYVGGEARLLVVDRFPDVRPNAPAGTK